MAKKHAFDFSKSRSCYEKLADAQKLKNINDFNIKLAVLGSLKTNGKCSTLMRSLSLVAKACFQCFI